MYKFSDEEFEKMAKGQTIVGQDFFEAAYKYWFNDREGSRSPFPEKIHEELSRVNTRLFMEWILELKPGDEQDEHAISGNFARILCETAMGMVDSEDERISILYPNLPRMGDMVNSPQEGPSTVINRELVHKDELPHLKLFMTSDKNGQVWDTLFALEDGLELKEK